MSLLLTSRTATIVPPASCRPAAKMAALRKLLGCALLAAFCVLPSVFFLTALPAAGQTIPHVTGTFKTPENKTPSAAGLRTLATINSVAVYGSVDFVPTNTASNAPTRLLYGGITYPPQPVRAWIKADGTLVDDYTAAAGVDLVPTVGATPTGLAMCATIRFAASADTFTPAVSWTECKELPASASVDWGTLPVATITTPAQSYQLTSGGAVTSYETWTAIAAPSNPASGNAVVWFDISALVLKCKTSTGADCNPAGSGGAPAFTVITSGTNTTATMHVGSGSTLDATGTGVLNASHVNGTKFTNAESLGKIPIGQGNGTAVWSDPLVQGTYAPGTNTSTGGLSGGAINPVLVGGSDYAGTPLLRNLKVDSSGQLYLGNSSLAVTGTFWQATQPVSGTFWQATQPVSIASLPALTTGSAQIGHLEANQSVNVAQLAGGTLGAMANYGTSPGAVLVPGVNAFITNTVPVTLTSTTITGTVAATQSGTWNMRNQDGAGNALTSNSTTYTAKFGLDSNLLGTLGTAFTTPGFVDIKGADGNVFVRQTTASNLNATVVGTGTFTTQAQQSGNWSLRAQDGAGNALTSNSTTYTAKFGLDANLLGTLGTAFSTAGKVDVKAADGDVFVRQTTAANLNATVVGTGTFTTQAQQSGTWTVQPGNTANTTAWLMNVGQFGGTNVSTGTGAAGAGIPRVTVSNDSNILATQSGTWNMRAQDGAGNALTSNSTTYTAKFGLDANLLGTLGTAFSTAGKVDVKAADGDVFVRQATGTNLHAVLDSGTVTANQGGAPWSVNVSNIPHTICDSGCAGGSLSNNSAAPSNNNGGVLGYLANAVAPSYSEGNQVLASVDLNGVVRMNCTIGCSGSASAATLAAQNIQTTYLTELATPLFPHAANGASGPNAWASSAVNLTGCEYSGMLPNLLSGQAVPCQIDRFGRALVSIGASVPITANVADASGVRAVFDHCQSNTKTFGTFSLTANTQILTGAAGKKFYFCDWNDQNGGTAQNYAVVESAVASCASANTAVGGLSGGTTAAGGWNTAANGGRVKGGLGVEIAATSTAGDNVCILISGSTQLSGGYSYVLAQ